ncbi:Rha family transcriptional regulator [uncultured Microbulbifer sp.]|uniref:Rha family transcriptional regulator n=1 Tax=uncultured Microbulbifer sp. TaxID=348147 RepID=UPI002615499D|nr:Rha family transcriptional regulator [uncultured Microbulbifer sp.]
MATPALIPTDAIVLHNNQVRTNSIKVAEAFGKHHRDVLRKLKNLDCSLDFTERNFALSEYTDSTGRSLPVYEMTKDGFIFVVMGFAGKRAAQIKEAYIETFNRMNRELYGEPSAKKTYPVVNMVNRNILFGLVQHMSAIYKIYFEMESALRHLKSPFATRLHDRVVDGNIHASSILSAHKEDMDAEKEWQADFHQRHYQFDQLN